MGILKRLGIVSAIMYAIYGMSVLGIIIMQTFTPNDPILLERSIELHLLGLIVFLSACVGVYFVLVIGIFWYYVIRYIITGKWYE